MKKSNTKAKSARRYSERTLKLLWGRAAGRCAVPNCRIFLYEEETRYDPAVPIGDIAHMAAASDSGPRAQPTIPTTDRDDYDNLILLCKICHARIDGQKNTYSIEYIQNLKKSHEKWVEASLPERGRSRTGWSTIVLEDQFPIDTRTFDTALEPDYIQGDILRCSAVGSWADVISTTRQFVRHAFGGVDSPNYRFAVFPLARVSSCLTLGYFLTNRPTTRLFQYHRDHKTWAWPRDAATSELVRADFTGELATAREVVFAFHLSAHIDLDRIRRLVTPDCSILQFFVSNPTTGWLQSEAQLVQLGIVARSVFERALHTHSHAEMWHIFYAGPAPGAVLLGQQLNPTMTPPVQLYEYTHPNHHPSALLNA